MEHRNYRKTMGNVVILVVAAILLAGTALYSNRCELRDYRGAHSPQSFLNTPARFAAFEPSNDPTAAPDFTLKSVEGRTITLSSYRGKVVILDFWATWCPPCKAEIPDYLKLYSEYKKDGFQMLGISVDQGGIGVVKSFVKEYGINYPIMMATDQVVKAYGGIRGIPTTFVIDKQGRIVDGFEGYRPASVFKSLIDKLTKER